MDPVQSTHGIFLFLKDFKGISKPDAEIFTHIFSQFLHNPFEKEKAER